MAYQSYTNNLTMGFVRRVEVLKDFLNEDNTKMIKKGEILIEYGVLELRNIFYREHSRPNGIGIDLTPNVVFSDDDMDLFFKELDPIEFTDTPYYQMNHVMFDNMIEQMNETIEEHQRQRDQIKELLEPADMEEYISDMLRPVNSYKKYRERAEGKKKEYLDNCREEFIKLAERKEPISLEEWLKMPAHNNYEFCLMLHNSTLDSLLHFLSKVSEQHDFGMPVKYETLVTYSQLANKLLIPLIAEKSHEYIQALSTSNREG